MSTVRRERDRVTISFTAEEIAATVHQPVGSFWQRVLRGDPMGPTVGRIVHYVAFGTPGGEYAAGAHRAAIVTEVHDDRTQVTLCVFNPTGLHFRANVPEDQALATPGSWHWPERD
jgi:hypothetical protein